MTRLLVLFSVALLIVGAGSIFSIEAAHGAYFLISAILMYLLYRALTSQTVLFFMAPVANWNTYRSPGEIIEAASVLEQHRSGKELDTGGDVHITQAIWECDYSVHLNANTLLESNDPKINVHDERTDPDVEMVWNV